MGDGSEFLSLLGRYTMELLVVQLSEVVTCAVVERSSSPRGVRLQARQGRQG